MEALQFVPLNGENTLSHALVAYFPFNCYILALWILSCIVAKTIDEGHNIVSVRSDLHAYSAIKPPFCQWVCDSWELSAHCYHDLNKGAGWCVYPQDLEIDGMRDSEGVCDGER